MEVETTKMSSKGQIVIPQDIRKEMAADEGTIFAVIGNENTIILKKLETPSKQELIKDLKNMAKEGKKNLQSMGIKEKDIGKIIHKSR